MAKQTEEEMRAELLRLQLKTEQTRSLQRKAGTFGAFVALAFMLVVAGVVLTALVASK